MDEPTPPPPPGSVPPPERDHVTTGSYKRTLCAYLLIRASKDPAPVTLRRRVVGTGIWTVLGALAVMVGHAMGLPPS